MESLVMFPSATAASPAKVIAGNLAAALPSSTKMTPASRIFRQTGYSDLMPTMTALGVPHFTSRPSTLLRQTITDFLTGAAGGGAGAGAGAAA
jgi:hypothetical protein